MKRTIITLNIVFAALVMAIQLGNQKAQTFNSSTAIAAPARTAMAEPMPNRCPNIHAAMEGLRTAEQELRDAGHDFCGHKRDAIEQMHRAFDQLKMAEGCDRCR
jgi:hypothetical protein